MRNIKNILLASHGTKGAAAAERALFRLIGPRARVHHLIVVPEFWKGMMGDDWLNNASTRDVFGRYVEGELEKEVLRHVARLRRASKQRRFHYDAHIEFGNPADCLLRHAARVRPEIVILGAPRPKGVTGLRSRMLTDDVMRALAAPLYIVPQPRERRGR